MKISEWRKKEGLTLQQMADKLGCSKQALAKYDKGTGTPGLELAVAIHQLTKGKVSYEEMIHLRKLKKKETVSTDTKKHGFDDLI
ncbi:MAG: helix-turn-helix transcriptional regulator [Desulfobacteraceae bacterium]|jgi:transcriptional regulator with XRE-family HTH domain